jgi:O-antigen biosynthesis protein
LQETDYGRWISSSATMREERVAMRRLVAGMSYLPRVSLVLVISDADEVWIKSSVDSALRQVYPRLEMCICDNGSERPHVPEVLQEYVSADRRVETRRLPEKKGWSEAHNAAISMATGEYVALLEAGDELAPEAIFKVVELLQSVRADVVYTDEDHTDISGRRSDPVFKPYWSPDLLLSAPYTGRLCVVRAGILETPDVFREGFDGAEEHDLMLRLSERTDRIRHLPEVLYHRRMLTGKSGPDEDQAQTTSRAIRDALVRRGEDAGVEPGPSEGSFRVVRRVGGRPGVGVVVSVPEGATDVALVGELLRRTSYPIHRIVVAGVESGTHGSAGHDVSHPFLARALNLAAAEAGGEYLVFVDGGARITEPDWLLEMLRQAQRREVGAVGCRLVNQFGGLRHGGSVVEMSQLTGSAEEPVSEGGHYLPLVDHTFNLVAAPAECMMVRREPFERVEGFDDVNLPTALYDLDLSFRLRESGLLNVYTPHARVVFEGIKPGPRKEEIEYVWNRWWGRVVQALYYQRPPFDPAHQGLDRETLSVLPP